jgi:hypothetical protein
MPMIDEWIDAISYELLVEEYEVLRDIDEAVSEVKAEYLKDDSIFY